MCQGGDGFPIPPGFWHNFTTAVFVIFDRSVNHNQLECMVLAMSLCGGLTDNEVTTKLALVEKTFEKKYSSGN